MQITFYNRNGDPVVLEDTEANRVAMEKAGFSTTDPKSNFSVRSSGKNKKSTRK